MIICLRVVFSASCMQLGAHTAELTCWSIEFDLFPTAFFVWVWAELYITLRQQLKFWVCGGFCVYSVFIANRLQQLTSAKRIKATWNGCHTSLFLFNIKIKCVWWEEKCLITAEARAPKKLKMTPQGTSLKTSDACILKSSPERQDNHFNQTLQTHHMWLI